MKTKRELELEIELYSAREQLLRANYEIMMRDKEINDQLLSNARFEMDNFIHQEEEKTNGDAKNSTSPDVKKLTLEQALIISGFTGVQACSAEALKADAEKRFGEQAGDISLSDRGQDKVRALYNGDYARLCPYANPESDNRLTEEQAIIVTGYTGMLLGDVDKFYADLEKRLGRKIVNAELPSIGQDKISLLYEKDFLQISSYM